MKTGTKKALKVSALLAFITAWLGFVFSNSLKNSEQSANQSELAEGVFEKFVRLLGISGSAETVAEIVVRKAAHVFEFFVLSVLVLLLLSLLFKSTAKVYAFTALFSVLCACTDEALQTVSHRGASLKDIFIDSIGIALCLLLYRLWNSRKNNGQRT